ncbi:MAG TPA: hypothetical protein VGY48_18330 [Vicinamibacterales bacterium]|jgi:hypothetical protein|nr:hypothetical protein [Vicinamibacterales bacterium]
MSRPAPRSASPPGAPAPRSQTHHEESDANITAVLSFAGGLIVTVAVVALVVWVFFQYLTSRAAQRQPPSFPLATAQENRLPPEPRLQTDPRQDLQDLRDAEREILTTYGWVDRNAGVVRIPIDQAMRLALQRGLPARDQRP